MIWLTWRQFRIPAVVAFAGLAASAILLALTSLHDTAAVCGVHSQCAPADGQFLGLPHLHLVKFLSTGLVAVPAVIGVFWGAPLLARELETGTYRLAWTQGVTRQRWLAVKVAVVGLVGVAVTGVLVIMLTWWSSAQVNLDRFSSAMFDERGIAPLGDAVFGFALGVAAGMVIRRTLPAMATTLAGFVAARLAVTHWVVPHFATPLTLTAPLGPNGPDLVAPGRGDWVVANNIVDAAGHVVNFVRCQVNNGPSLGESGSGHAAGAIPSSCIAQYHQLLAYQPAGRYWTFQADDFALFAGAGLLLVGFCFWWLRRRLI